MTPLSRLVHFQTESTTVRSRQGQASMPVLAIGGEKAYGAARTPAGKSFDVTALVVPGCGHWLMETREDGRGARSCASGSGRPRARPGECREYGGEPRTTSNGY
jgi:hypothetical protein